MIKLMQGDCLELMNNIPDGSVDMVLCDLPYGTTRNRWDITIPFEPLWKQYHRICKDNAAICLFGQAPFSALEIMSNPKEFRYEWIYEKTRAGGFLNANRMPLQAHEKILVFYKKLPTYNPQFEIKEPYKRSHSTNGDGKNYGRFERSGTITVNDGKRHPRSVIKFSNDNYNSLHPTQKPIPLLEYLIKTYTNEGETVLDNTMGSGSTGVAAINTGRSFIGIELDKNYFNIAKERINSIIP